VLGVGYTLILVNPDLHQYAGLHLSLTKLTIINCGAIYFENHWHALWRMGESGREHSLTSGFFCFLLSLAMIIFSCFQANKVGKNCILHFLPLQTHEADWFYGSAGERIQLEKVLAEYRLIPPPEEPPPEDNGVGELACEVKHFYAFSICPLIYHTTNLLPTIFCHFSLRSFHLVCWLQTVWMPFKHIVHFFCSPCIMKLHYYKWRTSTVILDVLVIYSIWVLIAEAFQARCHQ